jgi:hypothetical protein
MLDLGFKLGEHGVEVGNSGSTLGVVIFLPIPVAGNSFLDVVTPPVQVLHPEDPLRLDADVEMPTFFLWMEDRADLRVSIPAFDVFADDLPALGECGRPGSVVEE